MSGDDDDMYGDEDDFLEQSPLDMDLDCDELGIDYAGSDANVEQSFGDGKPPVVQFSQLQNPTERAKVLRGTPVSVKFDKANAIVKVTMSDGRVLVIKP